VIKWTFDLLLVDYMKLLFFLIFFFHWFLLKHIKVIFLLVYIKAHSPIR